MKMPVDYKRINGPDESVPYCLFTRLNTRKTTQKFEELLNNGTRLDSRNTSDHRKIFMKTGVVSQAKGSAYIEVDKTKVIVSVFDPREIPNRNDYSAKGEIYCEFKFAPFSCPKRRLHQRDAEEKHYSALMKQALEAAVCRHEFPNFQVDIYALVLQNDGSALSAAITASGLALSHAGVPMYDLITSVTLGIQGELTLLDPTLEEQEICEIPISRDNEESHGVIVLAMLYTHEQVSQFYQVGNLSLDSLSKCLEMLQKSCKDLVPLVQNCLVKHVVKTVTNNVED